MVHRGAGLVISRSGVGEEVGGVESRSIPKFVQIPVELVRSGFGDVVDLRGSISPLVDGVGERIDRDFGDGIEAQDEIRREAAVQVRQRVIGFQPVDDVAVRERRQAVELHVAIAVRAADEVVAAAGGVHQGARRELQRIRHVAAGVRQVLQRRGVQRRRGVRVLRIHQRRLARDGHLSFCGSEFEGEVDGLFLSQARRGRSGCGLRLEALCLDLDAVRARLQLRETKAAGVICFRAAL